jgi:hypothetical protein
MRWLCVAFGFVLLLGANGGGCSDPHVVGVQDYGSVTGRVLDATTNLPIPNALISVGSLFTASADGRGAFVMSRVPIGQQTVTVRAPGYSTVTADITITKDEGVSIGYARLVPIANPSGMSTLPPPPIPTSAPSPTPAPIPTQTPAP